MEEHKPNVTFEKEKNEGMIHDLKGEPKPTNKNILAFILVPIVVLAGVLTGYFFSQKKGELNILKNGKPKMIKSEKIVGSTDTKSFRDKAEGKLEKGGIDGEGTHKLIRPGGASQTAYLTSSVIDLDQFIGKKIRVWGETFQGQKAGWLMDVGRVEIL